MIRPLALLCLASLAGCRGMHEAAIKQRLVPTRFFAHEVRRPLPEIEAWLGARKAAAGGWCALCVVSERVLDDGGHEFCLSSEGETTCVIARAAGPGVTRFVVADPTERVAVEVVRALWGALEPQALAAAELADPDTLAALAVDEEAAFTPRWSFVAGAKAGAVVSYDPTTFTFGGQAGFRYWASPFVVPGAVLELENMLQANRALVAAALLGRVELTLWSEENPRFFNLPRLSFVFGAGPLVGFGREAALGGRSVFGIHLVHLGRFVTPFFFEVGFQALEVDRQSSTGLRVALGLGF
jgi:hypothetical protein